MGHLVDEVGDVEVWDAAVGFQADLAGAAVAVAYLDAVVLKLLAQFSQCPAVDLGVGPTSVTGKATTADALGQEDVVAAQAR